MVELNFPAVRIFIIPGTLNGSNLGDLAMFQVAMERLQTLWPHAKFFVLAQTTEMFRGCCPQANLVSTREWSRWLARQRGAWKTFFPPRSTHARRFSETLFNCNLVVMTGAGILTNAFGDIASRILKILRAASRRGIPVVIVGQGIGPLGGDLLAEAADVLPQATAIFLREPETSVAWLQRMNADAKRISITGDDAIELAARQTPCASPNGIGVNLRLASYAGIQSGTVEIIRDVLHRKADELGSRLIGIPISRVAQDADLSTINILAPEDRELEQMPWTAAAVIERVSRCRLVVTGSYHAGVFALAQGIPVVAIAQSEYYAGKFNGLARQFGCGCAVILSGEETFAAQLENAVAQAWNTTDAVKAELRAAAARQIAAGRAAYERLRNLVPTRNHLAGRKIACPDYP